MDAPGPYFDMMRRMINLTKDESLRDLTLSVSGENFKVHKFVMAAASPKLHKMIAAMQSDGGNDSVLTVNEVSCKGMRHLLFYIYSGKFPEFDTSDDVVELEKAAEILEVGIQGLHELIKSDTSFAESNFESPEIYIEVTTVNEDDTISSESIEGISESEAAVYSENLLSDSEMTCDHRYGAENEENVSATVKIGRLGKDICFEKNSEVLVHIVGEKESECDDDSAEHYYHDIQELVKPLKARSKHPKANVPKQRAACDPPLNSEFVVNGLDISKLFSTAKRSSCKIEYPPVPDPSLALKRGRPRLPNDYLFPNSPPYICPHRLCTKECDTREKLKKHYRTHDERTHTCETCHKKFLYRKDLICHFRTHTGEKPFKCEVCGKGFSQKATLQYHTQMHDDSRKQYYCEECSKHYKTFKGLQNHIEKIHGMGVSKHDRLDVGTTMLQNPVACPVCSVRFRVYESMYHHVKRQHPGSELIKQMPKAKTQRKNKKELMDSMVGTESLPSNDVDLKASDASHKIEVRLEDGDETSFFCMSCSLSFREKDTFVKHIQKCNKDTIRLLFMCGYCKDCFDSEDLRAEHIATAHKSHQKCISLETNVVPADVDIEFGKYI